MSTNRIKKFNDLPLSFLMSFLDFLEDEKNYNLLKEQIGNTGIMVEMNGYQLSIQSETELSFIKSELEAIDERERV